MANILNLPAGIVPITKVTEDDQEKMNDSANFKGLVSLYLYYGRQWGRVFWIIWQLQEGRMAKSACQNSEGLPLTIQIIGRRYHEEKILRVMDQLENVTNFKMIKQ